MTFYWRHSGQEHEFGDIPELLTVGLLEEDYNEYLFLLVTAAHNNIDISHVLNSTSTSKNWYSSHAQSLAYLVGSITDEAKSLDDSPDIPELTHSFYGKPLSEGIPDEDGCNILELMITLGADLTLKNYYEEDIWDTFSGPIHLNTREKNDSFKTLVNSLRSFHD
jgi:hypothetical protein